MKRADLEFLLEPIIDLKQFLNKIGCPWVIIGGVAASLLGRPRFTAEVRVMLDFDLAELYGVETKQLKRAVRRNFKRFPDDFMFQLTKDEYHSLRCQIGTLKRGAHRIF